mmetsp:Transcript_11946/g.25671  ORF Transcript_11946/g.25671 Transcript_11946/m.25671 type:complete len:212 (-) Transcript_11946:300-935(-)
MHRGQTGMDKPAQWQQATPCGNKISNTSTRSDRMHNTSYLVCPTFATTHRSDAAAGVCKVGIPVATRDTKQRTAEALPKFQTDTSEMIIENLSAVVTGSRHIQRTSDGGQLKGKVNRFVVEIVYNMDGEEVSYSLSSLLVRKRYASDEDSLSLQSREDDCGLHKLTETVMPGLAPPLLNSSLPVTGTNKEKHRLENKRCRKQKQQDQPEVS